MYKEVSDNLERCFPEWCPIDKQRGNFFAIPLKNLTYKYRRKLIVLKLSEFLFLLLLYLGTPIETHFNLSPEDSPFRFCRVSKSWIILLAL
jgi:hypothetical protein